MESVGVGVAVAVDSRETVKLRPRGRRTPRSLPNTSRAFTVPMRISTSTSTSINISIRTPTTVRLSNRMRRSGTLFSELLQPLRIRLPRLLPPLRQPSTLRLSTRPRKQEPTLTRRTLPTRNITPWIQPSSKQGTTLFSSASFSTCFVAYRSVSLFSLSASGGSLAPPATQMYDMSGMQQYMYPMNPMMAPYMSYP